MSSEELTSQEVYRNAAYIDALVANPEIATNEDRYDFLGFGVGDYKGFSSEEIQRVGPFGKVHLLAGQNNSGKSSLIDFCFRCLKNIKEQNFTTIQYLTKDDVPLGTNDIWLRHTYRVSLAFSKRSLMAGLVGQRITDEQKQRFDEIISSDEFSHGDSGVVWVDFRFGPEKVRLVVATGH